MTQHVANSEYDLVTVAQSPQELVPPVNGMDLEVMFTYLLRFPSFFDEASLVLHVNHFEAIQEGHWRFLWETLLHARQRYGTFVCDTLRYLAHTAYTIDPGLVQPEGASLLLADDGIIATAMARPIEGLQLALGRMILQKFLHERAVVQPLVKLATCGWDGQYVANLPDVMDRLQAQQRRITALNEQPLRISAPERGTVMPPPNVYTPTGVAWIDDQHGLGGQRQGDCNGILAVTGGGKSTFIIHLCVANAHLGHTQAQQAGGHNAPVASLFSYEESLAKMEPRAWSTAFKIRRTKLDTLDWDTLTGPDNMEPYERQMANPQYFTSGDVDCERVRWDMNRGWMNSCFKMYDMSASEQFQASGRGGLPEIVSLLDRQTQETGRPVSVVGIDWAGLLLSRYMEANHIADDKIISYLSRFADECRQMIAEPFKCVVWVMHQLNGVEQNSAVTKLQSHSNAMGCKTFANGMAVCGCFSNYDRVTGVRRFNWSKVRYKPADGIQPLLLNVHPLFCEFESVGNRFAVDDTGHRIVDRATFDQVEGGAPGRQERRAQNGPLGLRRRDLTDLD